MNILVHHPQQKDTVPLPSGKEVAAPVTHLCCFRPQSNSSVSSPSFSYSNTWHIWVCLIWKNMSFLFSNLFFPEFLTALKMYYKIPFFLYHWGLELLNLIFVKWNLLCSWGLSSQNLLTSSSNLTGSSPRFPGGPTCHAGIPFITRLG